MSPISPDIALTYLRGIMEISKINLPTEIVENISSALIPLISPADGGHPIYTTKLLENFAPILVTYISQIGSAPNFQTFITLTGQILDIMIEYKDLQGNSLEIYKLIEKLILNLLGQLILLAKKTIDNKGANFPADINEFLPKINTIAEWLKCSRILFIRSKHNGAKMILEYMVFSPDISIVMEQCIKYMINAGTQRPDTIRSCTGFAEFDNSINEMKEKSLNLANTMLEYVYPTSLALKIFNTPLFNFCKSVGHFAVLSVMAMCIAEHDDLEKLLDNTNISDLTCGFLRLMTNMLEDNNFYAFFSQMKEKVIVDICLILLRTTLKEKGYLIADPENFINLALDTCDKQQSGVCKTESAKLLEAICDHIDGALTFVGNFCSEAMNYACKGNDTSLIPNYPTLAQFTASCPFLSKSSPELIVETCIMALADISYLSTRRADMIEKIDSVIEENMEIIMEGSSILIKCRFVLLLAYYADHLFPNKQTEFSRCIEFMVKCLSLDGNERVLALQSADALKSIISDEDMIKRIEMFINKLVPYFTGMVENIKLLSFFNILKSVIRSYAEAMDDSVVALVKALTNRIIIELKDCLSKGQKINMTITNCWNIIRIICDDNSFFPQCLNGIEEALLPLFNYLVDPMNIEFDDDLVQVISVLVKRRSGITENMGRVLPYLQKLFEKNKGLFAGLLECLNNYLFYGREQFAANKSWIDLVLNMAHAALYSVQPPIEVNASEGAILMQIVLQNLGNGILDTYIPPLIKEVIKRFEMNPVPQILAIQLYNVILCAACNNSQITIRALNELGKDESLLNMILHESAKFKTVYDRKVLAIGLSNIIVQDAFPDIIKKLYPVMLNVIITALQTQEQEETKKMLKSDKKAIKLSDINGESSSSESNEEEMSTKPQGEEKKPRDEDSDEGYDSENEEMPKDASEAVNATIDKIQGQIKKIDEYSYVGTVIRVMFGKNPEATKLLVNNLNEVQQEYLKQIMQSRRITTMRKGERVTVARRIVKPKHKITKEGPNMQ